MIAHKQWQDREIAYVLFRYVSSLSKIDEKNNLAESISQYLRNFAVDQGYTIDKNFRNIGEVQKQIEILAALWKGKTVKDNEKYERHKLILRLYRENEPIFNRLLKNEKLSPLELYLDPFPNINHFRVYNKTYGSGTITKFNGTTISVKYDKIKGIHSYINPSCFENDLELLTNITPKTPLFLKPVNKSQMSIIIPAVTCCKSTREFVNIYKDELRKEIFKLKSTGGKYYRITNGQLIEKVYLKQNIYVFETETDFNFPDGQPIQIIYRKQEYSGNIISCSEGLLIFSTNYFFGKNVHQVEIKAEPWQLLEALCDRLDEMISSRHTIASELITDGSDHINKQTKPRTGQNTALEMARAQKISFIWGPPGTGKTQTLAEIALDAISEGKRVLMLSYSNVSVDGAIQRVYSLYKEKHGKNIPPGKAVRYGYPKNVEVLNHPNMTTFNLAIAKNFSLEKEQKELLKKQEGVSPKSPDYILCEKRLAEIHNKMKEEEKEITHNAAFVATTVSKAVIDEALYTQSYDVVLFDEASMSYIPQVVFSASLASKHFICLGDFCQLPPIVQNDQSQLLNIDIFQYCGISDAVYAGCGHDWLCLLDTQYRMHPNIAEFVNAKMYQGLLRSGKGMADKQKNITAAVPIPYEPLVLADISGMMSVCTKTSEGSYINVLSAMICTAMAINIAQYHEVGIITPYNAQARLLRAIIRDVKEKLPHQITCATVHQFQGSEKDVIIYDAVDCYRRQYPGQLLTSNTNNEANKLFNVAVTRAKGKFIVVTNKNFMVTKKLSRKLLFRNLLDTLSVNDKSIQGNQLLEAISHNHHITVSAESEEIFKQFLQNLKGAKKVVYIDIPETFDSSFSSECLNILSQLQRKKVDIHIRANNLKTLPKEFKDISQKYDYIYNPVTIIDNQCVWFGMPPSRDNFKTKSDKGTLEKLPTNYRPVIRIDGKNTSNAIFNFLDMAKAKVVNQRISLGVSEKLLDYIVAKSQPEENENKKSLSNQTITKNKSKIEKTNSAVTRQFPGRRYFSDYISQRFTCKKCHKPLILHKSRKSFWLVCSSCNETRKIEEAYLRTFLMFGNPEGDKCPICGSSLDIKTNADGFYFECTNPDHVHQFALDMI